MEKVAIGSSGLQTSRIGLGTWAIADDHHSLRGVIPLTDIGTAMQTLQ